MEGWSAKIELKGMPVIVWITAWAYDLRAWREPCNTLVITSCVRTKIWNTVHPNTPCSFCLPDGNIRGGDGQQDSGSDVTCCSFSTSQLIGIGFKWHMAQGNSNGKYYLLLRPLLYKVMCRLDCHSKKQKERKFRSACAKCIRNLLLQFNSDLINGTWSRGNYSKCEMNSSLNTKIPCQNII